MNSKVISYIVYSIIGLAVLGLIISLIENPGGLLKSILTVVLIAGVILLIFRFLSGNRMPLKADQKAFMRAARLSKKRLKKQSRPKRVVNKHKKAIRRSAVGSSHLTVIEGKKGKKRNRAMH